MAYVVKSGLLWLVTGVRTYLTAAGVNASVACGFKARNRILNQGTGQANRIVFSPSDDNGNGGRLVPTRKVGQRYVGGTTPQNAEGSIRSLFDWERVCIASVWTRSAQTPGATEDARDAAEIEANEQLVEWMIRAVSSVGLADIQFGAINYTVPDERSFGIEARVALTFQTPFFDVPADIIRPHGAITKVL